MKQGLSLRVSQHLALTPQLQQSIRLLQLSTLELGQEIQQMLDENPFLEVQGDDAPEEFGIATSDARAQDDGESESAYEPAPAAEATSSTPASEPEGEPEEAPSWEGDGTTETVADDGEWGGDAPAARRDTGDEEVDATDLARGSESLPSWLHRQALSLRLSETDRMALRFLIESLNDDGYLEDSLEELARGLAPDDLEQQEELQHRFTVALRLLQSLDPPGVGARNLAECLMLQLRAMQDTSPGNAVCPIAIKVCQQPIDLLAKRDVRRLAQLCGGSDAEVKSAIALITRLEPKPGRRFIDVERNIVVPDVIVTQVGRGPRMNFRVQLNPDVMPRLRVHDVYAGALKAHRGEGHQALQQRLQEARWFIKNIQQRFDTILRVSSAIVERQRNFFIHGELAMRPLVLREIADELGLHESTISRVTTAKYMATPFGTFELKYFFGSALGTETGGNASSTAVRALIRQFVAAENANKPLSDSQISELLKEQGIECARRTVAKYREALRIAPANLRKAL
ncbi:RNA polymerase factor sigma-54 [Ramlibacter ginsenosidimutans]|uniref:RNA polymerase sigma-54 factor n=1 Tax=Ramlibacter ginsenosidimutans TaxID=502333 RepID=A0A934WLG9_9BURK|nr:RNA polymerase factor sigma-54 [Ramlibacter ginsenosidimutans]MBK6005403.1 RNA polymerase factor sigma-54 [Ramlibacter ginsenosidimutans]